MEVELSANELAGMIRLAARGVGYPWGLAQEADFVCRWLVDYGLSAINPLMLVFTHADQSGWQALKPEITDDGALYNDQALCPILLGTTLSDRSALWQSNRVLTFKGVICPGLLLPFVAQAASATRRTIRLQWEENLVCHDGSQLYCNTAASVALAAQAHGCQTNRAEPEATKSVTLTCEFSVAGEAQSITASLQALHRSHSSRIGVDSHVWARIKQLAHRTYAPASDESRRLGAGAGTSDND